MAAQELRGDLPAIYRRRDRDDATDLPANASGEYDIALLHEFRASAREALLPTPIGVGRFVIRTTHERG
ncbi:MAG TPA: hypothetical protein VN888_03600, partial [Mycobacterium sp.]|nr:hypothetical protein [Mycobacterium sp.]